MSELNVIVRTADRTRKAEVTLEAANTGAEVIAAAQENWKLPRDTDYTLVNSTQGKPIQPQEKLDSVRPGDILEIQPILVAGAGEGGPLAERRRADLQNLLLLTERTGGKITVIRHGGDPLREIVLGLCFKTAGSSRYLGAAQEFTEARIQLPSRYPVEEPQVVLSPAVFHPNVYPGGRVCFGYRWIPSEGLDLLARRIVKILTFDPALLNESSPANTSALLWYRLAVRSNPGAFPTDRWVETASAPTRRAPVWKTMSGAPAPTQGTAAPATKTYRCSCCMTLLRIPVDAGTGRCGNCGNVERVPS